MTEFFARALDFPFAAVGRLLLEQLPAYLFQPLPGLLFWAVVLLVLLQYNRAAARERYMFDIQKMTPWREVVYSLVFGIVGGLIGSFILVYVGVILDANGSDFIYLWVVSLLLALWHPRFLCFSYSGGLLGISFLLFGWPALNLTAILAIIAVLHLIESLLILLDGASAASPVILHHPQRGAVGGFSLQRFWPVPLAVLLVQPIPPELLGQAVGMPDWWPWLPVAPHIDLSASSVVIWPVVAGLGFTDLALTRQPIQKSRRTAGLLLLYSIGLLILAVAGGRVPSLLWLAVLFSPLAHEWLIHFSLSRELRGRPIYEAASDGVRILDVVPGSQAEAAGFRPGAVIFELEGVAVGTAAELREQLRSGPAHPLFAIRQHGKTLRKRLRRLQGDEGPLGLVLVPPPEAPAAHIIRAGGMLRGLAFRLARRVQSLVRRL